MYFGLSNRGQQFPKASAESVTHPDQEQDLGEAQRLRPARLGWAKLLKRVFNLDLEHCPNCGGELKTIAAILEPGAIDKILAHLGLEARAPQRAAVRGQMAFEDI